MAGGGDRRGDDGAEDWCADELRPYEAIGPIDAWRLDRALPARMGWGQTTVNLRMMALIRPSNQIFTLLTVRLKASGTLAVGHKILAGRAVDVLRIGLLGAIQRFGSARSLAFVCSSHRLGRSTCDRLRCGRLRGCGGLHTAKNRWLARGGGWILR